MSFLPLLISMPLLFSPESKKLDSSKKLPEVQILSTRSNKDFVSTQNTLKIETLSPLNLGMEAPYLLQSLPSVSISSDAGNMVGYSQLNIRGSDAQRVQVSINGVAYNDAESHQVYWVNIPDILSSAEDVQVQRGVGFSMLGGTNLGGMVSIKTTQKHEESFIKLSSHFGSFNTFRNSINYSTGVSKKGWQLSGRATYNISDGYIDRAWSRLNSQYLSLSKFGPKYTMHLIGMRGHERTYQAWYGVESNVYKTNRTFNVAGTDYEQKAGAPYENQSDNYEQSHLQWIHNFYLNPNQNIGITGYYVNGSGFYEEYRVGQDLGRYFKNQNGVSDIVRQLWLHNHLFGLNIAHQYQKKNIQNYTALAMSHYIGDHFGRVPRIIDPSFSIDQSVKNYLNTSNKSDVTFFNKSALTIDKTTLNLDLQLRYVNYNAAGTLLGHEPMAFDQNFLFFNPKVGANYQYNTKHQSFIFAGIGQKEPNRSDFVESNQNPRPEQLLNIELGHQIKETNWNAQFNLFGMFYQDQLINTGAINSTGAPIRINVGQSYRVGAEWSGQYKINSKLTFNSSAGYIVSKILNFNHITPAYNEDYSINEAETQITKLEQVDIAFAPRWNAYVELRYHPFKDFSVMLNTKAVGRQFIDNTQNDTRSIPAYSFSNLAFEHILRPKYMKEMKLNLLINNIFNTLTYTNAYTYNTGIMIMNDGSRIDPTHFNFVFPQAGINLMMGCSVMF